MTDEPTRETRPDGSIPNLSLVGGDHQHDDEPYDPALADQLEHAEAPATDEQPPDLFKRWTMAELLAADLTPRWLVRGAVTDPTYGQIAGEMKTLKTYVGTLLNVAIASGEPFLDRFTVERPGPVLVYVGEGGRIPYTRRLVRVAEALGVDPATIDLITSYDVAAITSNRFQESLARDLDEIRPVLFNPDPYYAFHGASTDSRNLHEEGGLLTSVSAPCIAAGTTCLITNHFNQTGSGNGLKRITQAGSGEWADSWLLLAHREAADVPAGKFRLSLEIGSRQWGGTSWDLDLNIGSWDEHLNGHDGPITWDLRKASAGGGDSTFDRVVALVGEHPGELTKEEIATTIGGNVKEARRFVDSAVDRGRIWAQTTRRMRSDGRSYKAPCYFPTINHPVPSSDAGRNNPVEGP